MSNDMRTGSAQGPVKEIKRFNTLTVNDPEADVTIEEGLWTPILLVVSGKAYDVEEALHEGRHYMRCVRAYKNLEFEKLWGFSCFFADYTHHKIIVIKRHT